MTFSLNEIEAMGKRAARGAGLDWGIAEETGKAVRWLAAHGLPGPELLADLLARNEGRPYDALAPMQADGVWQARTGRLCPLIAGAALADRARELVAGRSLDLGPTAAPLLLAPFAATAARMGGVAVDVSWPGVILILAPGDGFAARGAGAAVVARGAEHVQCRMARESAETVPPSPRGRTVDPESWGRLDALAHLTYAPATEASRMVGAGAGINDDD